MRIMLEVERKGVVWNVSGEYSESWFERNLKNGTWEDGTFDIINRFRSEEGVLIDIGAWIGPISLFASRLFSRVISFEPDEVAFQRFEENLAANNFPNIAPINKGISFENGKIQFGGNGALGNSASTMMLDNLSAEGEMTEVEVVVLEETIENLEITPEEVTICKMDIEGGEKLVVPAIKDFLCDNDIPLLIALHWGTLSEGDIREILTHLFSSFDNCRYIYELDNPMAIEEIVLRKLPDLLFFNDADLSKLE